MNAEAEALNEEANGCEDDERAKALYLEAARLAPEWSAPLYNLGLLTKYQHRWAESLEFNRQAVALSPGDEAAWWNMGIAATAVGDWKSAREAWAGFGLQIPAGDGPLEMVLGLTPIRVAPDEGGEVVWCDRIDPARARIRSVPLPDSGRRYGDLLLHDGAPNGERRFGDRIVPVFDELVVLHTSAYATFEVEVTAPTQEGLEEWLREVSKAGLTVEDWTSSVAILCRACSEGRPHEHHDAAPVAWVPERQVGIAATDETALHRTLQAIARPAGLRVQSVELVLPGTRSTP